MPSFVVVTRDGTELSIDGTAGASVMEAIRDHGVDELLALCGGCCSCATCHVYVTGESSGDLAPMTQDEDDLLDSSSYRNEASRLSCQLILKPEIAQLRVVIAPEE